MPTVRFGDRTVECDHGTILRDALVEGGASPHSGRASAVNCRGHGTCGTCAVAVEGPTGDRTRVETWRLEVPPHDSGSALRLACQTRVEGDLTVRKFPGFWGQHTDREPLVSPGDE